MWVKAQHVGLWVAALYVGIAGTWSGCSSVRQGTGCVEGLRSSCTCAGGGLGIHTCQSDSTFNACDCTMGPHAGSGAVTGGRSGGGGSGGAAGGAGVSAGGRSGGSGGNAGTAGAAGQAGTGILGVAAYGACHTSADCRANATCVRASTSTSAPGYCSPNCTSGGNQCFRIAIGEVRATCSNGSCVLGNCDTLACPPGMNCVKVTNPMGSGPSMTSSCVYPSP